MHRLIPQPQRAFARTSIAGAGSLALAFLLLALSGCSSHDTTPSAMTDTGSDPICDREWLLDSLTVDGREHKPSMLWKKMWRDRPYLGCDKLGVVRGSAGSNPYLGKFQLRDNGAIQWLKPPRTTRMAGRRDSSELEKDFLLALPRATHAHTHGNRLVLEGDDGTRLEFKQAGDKHAQ
ncbi:META domain-containing protein [Microbulbifer salipaludis]|uniref:META domain-containing protein n=1 Tax=Microbulbifer salipaludis TaxID=187980 RepID=A0ABS3E3I0_9GAMM|nr:META domain-containing protein [Microbulbifer salipaludis]MBN8429858.1 META domain-containing protein [Microbulbifer salipaludis]